MKTLVSFFLIASALLCHGQIWENGTNLVVRGAQTNAGNVQASAFVGDGSAVTGIAAGNLSGTLVAARMPALTGDITTSAGSVATALANGAVVYSKIQNVSATQRALGRNTAGAGTAEEVTATQVLDWLGSTRGAVLYRGSGGWAILSPGASGTFLQSQGAGADPTYATPSDWTATLFSAANQTPAANTTYFFGVCPLTTLNTTYATCSYTVIKAGTIKSVLYWVQVAGTLATTGQGVASSIRVNNTTDVGTQTFDWNQTVTNVVASSLSQAVAANDTLAWKIVTPAVWTTTPTTCRLYCQILFSNQ